MTQEQRTPEKAIDFKSATLDTVRLVLQPQATETLLAQLQQHLEQSSGFFAGEAVVIDASALSQGIDWAALQQCLMAHQLHPIGVVASGATADSAEDAGLALLSLSQPHMREHPNSQAPTTTSPLPPEPAPHTAVPAPDSAASNPSEAPTQPTKIIQRQLRSGQRIYAKDSDLIVIGVVSQGAEVIADGNIHVYGPLRGRAMAGASGNAEARIFTTELDPELIAIAGVYKVIEEALPEQHQNKSAVISLHGESLKIESIS